MFLKTKSCVEILSHYDLLISLDLKLNYKFFVKFLKSNAVKIGLNIFSYIYSGWKQFGSCLSFNESQPVYAYKGYANRKDCM